MASPTRWTWVWASSRSWWWTGNPGVLWSTGSQRVEHDWANELNWTEKVLRKRQKELLTMQEAPSWILHFDWGKVSLRPSGILLRAFPSGLAIKNLPAMQEPQETQIRFLVLEDLLEEREWQPIPVFLPGESHAQKSLEGYSPYGCKDSDTTEMTEHSHMGYFGRQSIKSRVNNIQKKNKNLSGHFLNPLGPKTRLNSQW